MSEGTCGTCGKQAENPDATRCRDCWEVEHRLERYLRSAAGQRFVSEKLKKSNGYTDVTALRGVRPMDIGDVRPVFFFLNTHFMNESSSAGTLAEAILPKLHELLAARKKLGWEPDMRATFSRTFANKVLGAFSSGWWSVPVLAERIARAPAEVQHVVDCLVLDGRAECSAEYGAIPVYRTTGAEAKYDLFRDA